MAVILSVRRANFALKPPSNTSQPCRLTFGRGASSSAKVSDAEGACLPLCGTYTCAHDEEVTRRCLDTDEYDARTAAAAVEDAPGDTL